MKKNTIKLALIAFVSILSLNFYASENIPKLSNEQLEQIGELHNKYLEDYFNLIITKKSELKDNLSMFNMIIDYNIHNFRIENENNIEIDKDAIKVRIKEIESADEKLHQIFESTSDYKELESELNKEIEVVKTKASLSNADYNSIMSMYYVAKYSANFWYSIDKGGSGKGETLTKKVIEIYPTLFSKENSDFTPTKAKQIATADAVGAAVGGIRWCVATVWTGAGSVGGFVGGAILGAASASFQAWCLGVDPIPGCMMKEPFDYNSFKDIKTADDYTQYVLGMYYEIFCCYKTHFKASYCDKYLNVLNQD